jgi:hypothetical protein
MLGMVLAFGLVVVGCDNGNGGGGGGNSGTPNGQEPNPLDAIKAEATAAAADSASIAQTLQQVYNIGGNNPRVQAAANKHTALQGALNAGIPEDTIGQGDYKDALKNVYKQDGGLVSIWTQELLNNTPEGVTEFKDLIKAIAKISRYLQYENTAEANSQIQAVISELVDGGYGTDVDEGGRGTIVLNEIPVEENLQSLIGHAGVRMNGVWESSSEGYINREDQIQNFSKVMGITGMIENNIIKQNESQLSLAQ